jgi:hypothetical protein
MEKKAELTTQQLVMIIVLIASFAILLFFLFRLDLTETTNKELCYNSVVMRGNSVLPQATTPLNCHRDYVCITSDGTCEKMTKPILKNVKTKEDVYRTLAVEMTDCWWMFGEGKINYVGNDFIPELYCSVCSQVAFDNSLNANIFKEGNFSKKELYTFLTKEKVSGKESTYSEYLYKTNDLSKIHQGDFGKINFESQYYVLMGITSKASKLGWAAAGAGTLALIAVPAGGWVVGTVVAVAGGIAGTFAGTIIQGASGNDYLSPSLVEIGSKEYESLKCESIETLS